VTLIVNHDQYLMRRIANTGASSILEVYTSATLPIIKTDDNNTATWSTMGGKFTTTKTGIFL
jgi:hypothetical protein